MNKIIHTEKAPAAIGPYSQAVQAGNLLFVSGQIPVDPATGNFAGDIVGIGFGVAGFNADESHKACADLTDDFAFYRDACVRHLLYYTAHMIRLLCSLGGSFFGDGSFLG